VLSKPEPEGEYAEAERDDGPLTAAGWKTRGDTDGGRLAGVVDRMESDVRARLAEEDDGTDDLWLAQTEPRGRTEHDP